MGDQRCWLSRRCQVPNMQWVRKMKLEHFAIADICCLVWQMSADIPGGHRHHGAQRTSWNIKPIALWLSFMIHSIFTCVMFAIALMSLTCGPFRRCSVQSTMFSQVQISISNIIQTSQRVQHRINLNRKLIETCELSSVAVTKYTYTQQAKIYLSWSISVQFVHCKAEAVDVSWLTVSAVVAKWRDMTGTGDVGGLTKPRDVPDNVTSAAVDWVPADERPMPYCKTTVSSESAVDLHVPDPAHT